MTNGKMELALLRRLIEEDAVGQLRRRAGLMATLGSEDGALKLDWVEGIARLLADSARLEEVEAEARDIRARGIRHIIWAGMGGSVLAVGVLRDLGFCAGYADPRSPYHDEASVALYPLDSTDPAALNAITRAIAAEKKLVLPPEHRVAPAQAAGKGVETDAQAALLRSLLHDVMMIGVSMGMTSEEPITHLRWFAALLEQAQLRPADHLLVMTLPGSYLDAFAREHQVPSCPLQVDGGTGTGGRMSAPTTRVFLLPAAFALTCLSDESAQLRSVLRKAWDEHQLELAASHPAAHPFVRLAAALSAASHEDTCRLMLRMPAGWRALVPWIEQLMEESLGKDGKGVVVFDDQMLNQLAPGYRQEGTLHVAVVTDTGAQAPATHDRRFILSQPSLASTAPHDRLAALAASFLGWQLSMALYGYLHHIPFAGQPAVEHYKARARALRTQPDPLQIVSNWQPALRDGPLTLLMPREGGGQDVRVDMAPPRRDDAADSDRDRELSLPASAFARTVYDALFTHGVGEHVRGISLGYLDVTVNGEARAELLSMFAAHMRTLGNTLLGIPVKLRQAPAAYHSTEQSEMDGPAYVVSLRLVARDTETCLLGSYANTFLHAQALSTWQAMMETGRQCCLLIIDGRLDNARESLVAFAIQVESALRHWMSI